MKKKYNSPSLDMERFVFEDILTDSSLGNGDGLTDKPGLDTDDPDQGFTS